MTHESFRCYLVNRQSSGSCSASIEKRNLDDLAPGDVLVRVHYSSLNFKDALAATGQSGIARRFPHVPGIDAAGVVAASTNPRFKPGDPVFTTGHELGVERWGGWAELVRVPGEWLLPLPTGLTLEETMILGTAGFTAAQSVQALLHHGVKPEKGKILVTGATGGVASLAIMILARLGFRVVALTGKQEQQGWLESIGAAEVAGRELLQTNEQKPLLAARFAGAIDTIGGPPLASLLKMVSQRGCVACCGLTAGTELQTTVFPFILRGVTLAGIDSVWCPDEERPALWRHLATDWKPKQLHDVKRLISLERVEAAVQSMLRGDHMGRSIIDPRH
ncbi:acrylyl-CoA reductase family protein [Planctomicrobium sp. SH664]|uniref:acrylyl-CoA reductase family protein n=1 Tax=Planctomicrobium sp. SH664 TaxID=3448125 RepID=UPI003F5BC3FD